MEKWKFKVGCINFGLSAQLKIHFSIKLKNSFLPLSNKYNAFPISAFIVVCDSDLSLQFTHMIVNPADAQFTNDQRVRH